MSEIPKDIKEAAHEAMRNVDERGAHGVISKAILAERDRCLSIIAAIEPHNPSEAHLLETIARRVREQE